LNMYDYEQIIERLDRIDERLSRVEHRLDSSLSREWRNAPASEVVGLTCSEWYSNRILYAHKD
jgi:hypothetical protein